MLFIAGNVIISRIWSGNSSKAIVMMLYIFVMLLLAAPGVVLAIVAGAAGMVLFTVMSTAFLIMTVCNVLLSLLGFFLCRNMLQYADLNYQ